MADPVSWFAIAAAGAKAAGSLVEGIAAKRQGDYEGAVAGENAKTARENAARARSDAAAAEEAQRRQARKSLGRSAAAAAQSGVAGAGLGEGSTGAALKQASQEAELDALSIRYEGETTARGHESDARQFDMERKAAFQRGRMGLLSGVLGAASAGLSGAANYKGGKARADDRAARRAPPRRGSGAVRGAPIGGARGVPSIDPYGLY